MANEIISVGLTCYDHLVMVPSLRVFQAEPAGDPTFGDHAGRGGPVKEVLCQCGGAAATAAVAARRLGARVNLWSRVGSDRYGRFVIEELRARGVDTSQLAVVQGAQTPVSTVLVEEGTGERRFLYFPGRNLDRDREEPDYSRVERAKVVVVDGRWPGVCVSAARRARASGVYVVADVGGAGLARPAGEEETALLRTADYLIVSEAALPELAPGRSDEDLARELLSGAPSGAARAVVVTRGPRGVRVFEAGSSPRTLGAFKVSVVDTTGAGDVFRGAFAYGVSQGWSLARTVEVASAAAALSCTALGGQTAVPCIEKVEELLSADGRPEWSSAGD